MPPRTDRGIDCPFLTSELPPFSSQFLGFAKHSVQFVEVHGLDVVIVDADLLAALHVGLSTVAGDSDEQGCGYLRQARPNKLHETGWTPLDRLPIMNHTLLLAHIFMPCCLKDVPDLASSSSPRRVLL